VIRRPAGFRSADAEVDLAKKFGCAVDEAFSLLALGRSLGLTISGLSFHDAYTVGGASEFNSIPKTKILVVNGPS
jgi:hypothetical protein